MPEQNMPEFWKDLHAIRKSRNLSLGELSRRCGVSKTMLSQVEQNKVNPTISIIWKIAHSLDVPLHDLLAPKKEIKFHHLKNEDIIELERDNGGCVTRILSPMYLGENLELVMLTMKKGSKLESKPHLKGTDELASVISGKVAIETENEMAILEAGESIHYSADINHTIRNQSEGDSRVVVVVSRQE